MANKSVDSFEHFKPLPSRRTIQFVIAGIVLTLAVIIWLATQLHPLPPHTITMATGPEGSAYDTYGKRYQKLLAKDGIKLVLRQTAGGVENLALLRNPKSGVELGFVEGGVANDDDTLTLDSLGTVGYEPLWFFSRKPMTDRVFNSLRGKKVAVGPEGSDARALLDQLEKHNALAPKSFQMLGLEPEQAADELTKGHIDAVVIMSSMASPVVRKLITAPRVYLANFARADAYVSRFSSLYKLTLPEGSADLETDRPSQTTTLLATKTSLIVREDLHPVLQYLLLEAASKVHNRAGVFQKDREFPSPEETEIGLSKYAMRYYKSGKPFLQQYLPFWLAALVEQTLIVLIPLLGLLYPLSKGLMALYNWGTQRSLYLIYRDLHRFERELDLLGNRPAPRELKDHMRYLETRVNRVKVPARFMPLLYSLKDTMRFVRQRLERAGHSK